MDKKKLLGLFAGLLTVTAVFTACGTKTTESAISETGYRSVTAEEAKNLMDTESDYLILDVRSTEEYDGGHIPDAVLMPDYEVADRAEQELLKKDQLLLVYCRSGNRSKGAAKTLVSLGYSNVVEFGGINDWPYDIVQ